MGRELVSVREFYGPAAEETGVVLRVRVDSEIKAKLVVNTEAAVARGVFGIPSFLLGDELWFGKERLRDAVEASQGE